MSYEDLEDRIDKLEGEIKTKLTLLQLILTIAGFIVTISVLRYLGI